LVDKGLLLKEKNYFSDKATGYRHGNFYICGAGVRFEESGPHTTHTVSISYLSVAVSRAAEAAKHAGFEGGVRMRAGDGWQPASPCWVYERWLRRGGTFGGRRTWGRPALGICVCWRFTWATLFNISTLTWRTSASVTTMPMSASAATTCSGLACIPSRASVFW